MTMSKNFLTKEMSKRDKFKHYANRRLNNAVVALERVGNLCHRVSFEYSEADIEKIIKVLDESYEHCKMKLKSELKYKKDYF